MGHSTEIDFKANGSNMAAIVHKYCDIITATMGPGGNTVLIQSAMGAMATKDGVTVAQHINPSTPIDSILSQLIIDATRRTVNEVGDGTTTTACLLAAIFGCYSMIYSGEEKDKRSFYEGVDSAVKAVLEYLKEGTIQIVDDSGKIDVDALRHVATIAINGDKDMGGMIADLIAEIGVYGRVTLKENIGHTTYTERLQGYSFDTMLLGRQHLRDRAAEDDVLENPLFIICTDPFESVSEIEPIIREWRSADQLKNEDGSLRPLVIITNGLVGGARSFIAANARHAPIYVVQPPWGGKEGYEMMLDVQAMTFVRRVYDKTHGEDIKQSWGTGLEGDAMTEPEVWKEFGHAKRCILSWDKCSIIPLGDYDPSGRIAMLKSQISIEKEKSRIPFYEQRIAALASGLGVIYVGADSDVETHRLRHAVEDAQYACFTALKGGVVPGGGCGYYKASKHLWKEMGLDSNLNSKNVSDSSFWHGYALVLQAITAPAAAIYSNYTGKERFDAHGDLKELFNARYLKEFWTGWDAGGNGVDNMYQTGIIDPYKVCESALKNAVSVAKQLMSSSWALVQEQKKHYIGGQDPDNELDERIDKDFIKKFYREFDMHKQTMMNYGENYS